MVHEVGDEPVHEVGDEGPVEDVGGIEGDGTLDVLHGKVPKHGVGAQGHDAVALHDEVLHDEVLDDEGVEQVPGRGSRSRERSTGSDREAAGTEDTEGTEGIAVLDEGFGYTAEGEGRLDEEAGMEQRHRERGLKDKESHKHRVSHVSGRAQE